MANFLSDRTALYGQQEMLRVDGVGRTYERLHHDARSLARGLEQFGLGPGSRVGILMDTSHQVIDTWFAASLLGCVETPFNTNYRGSLLHHLIRDSEVEVIVCDAAYVTEVRRLVGDSLGLIVHGDDSLGAPSLADLYLDPTGWTAPETDEGGVILYTSGTTGPSKGVVHNQRGCIRLGQYVAEVGGYGPDDRLLNFFPLYHQNARYSGVMAALAAGAAIDLESKFSSSGFWRLCRERGITVFNHLGSVLAMISSASGEPDAAKDRDHSVRLAYGAGASLRDREEWRDRYGVELLEVYGLTEAPMAAVNIPGSGCAPGSAGRESALFELRVVDERGRPVPAGSPGDIQVRPKTEDVFTRGYYNNDRATVAATTDLWFTTGDRGCLTADGDVFFAERAKDSLRRRGENISAWEVESVLVAHPHVSEAAVYGVEVDGETEVMAAILVEDDFADVVDIADVVRAVAADLPRYAVPRFVRRVDDMPRTPTMKVQKHELKSQGITPDTRDLTKEK
ncbi:AMP-binding protein [Microbacterium immunditiarum]|uniref:Crotonobetaine/carnitine-CoA ligase n=1 Tax=Microbacterium immunditiarum TaxID=337480 RepID=A0A7Y9GLS3_9MICO|nr:AMP-binding protein [Microbacterium immunditiarum]NYE18811.1 crotonobetaine/carnitine-CoA ligase [Microbacterium immunditiarum]